MRRRCPPGSVGPAGSPGAPPASFAAMVSTGLTEITRTVAVFPGFTEITDAGFVLSAGSTGFTNANGILTYTGPNGRRFIVQVHVTADLDDDQNPSFGIIGVLLNGAPFNFFGAGGNELPSPGTDVFIGAQALLTLNTGDRLSIGMIVEPGPRELDLLFLTLSATPA